MAVERVSAQRLQVGRQLPARGHRKRGRDADVVQPLPIVVQTQQERPHQLVPPVLVPPEPGDNTIRGARVLHLDHRALSRLVRTGLRLGDHAIEPGALEPRQPFDRDLAVSCHRRQVNRWRDAGEQLLEVAAAPGLHHIAQILPVCGQ